MLMLLLAFWFLNQVSSLQTTLSMAPAPTSFHLHFKLIFLKVTQQIKVSQRSNLVFQLKVCRTSHPVTTSQRNLHIYNWNQFSTLFLRPYSSFKKKKNPVFYKALFFYPPNTLLYRLFILSKIPWVPLHLARNRQDQTGLYSWVSH